MAPETETYCARCGTSLAPGAYFCLRCGTSVPLTTGGAGATVAPPVRRPLPAQHNAQLDALRDRKSTRLNSSHTVISYAVFCLKKKNKNINQLLLHPTIHENVRLYITS